MAGGLNAIANLLGKVNASNALVVTLSGGSASATTMTVDSLIFNIANPDATFSRSAAGAIALTAAGTATTSTNGLALINSTAATALATVQISRRFLWRGHAWNTSASETVDFFAENLPATAATPTGTFKLGYSLNGAAATYPLTVSSAGALVAAGPVTGAGVLSTASVEVAAASSLYFVGRSYLTSGADGTFNLLNNANNAGVGLDFATDAVMKVRVRAQNAYATMDALAYQTSGNPVGYNLSAYGVGTAYALTNTAAAIDFGTTDPVKVLDKAGTYLIFAQVNMAYTGATVVAETAAVKVRRTNNTAADLSVVVPIDLPVSTTLTNTYGIVTIPPFVYTTAATDDAITIFANVSAALSAGTIDATAIGTSVVAVRLY